MKELPVEMLLVELVKGAGGRCIKLLPWVEGGLPDRLAILPGGTVWFIETKRPGGRLRKKGQKKWARILTELGCNYQVLDTKDKVRAWAYENLDQW